MNDNDDEWAQAEQTWTLPYIEHLGAFISGDLNIGCQNFACNTAVACRQQQQHNSLLLRQGHAVGQLAATTRTVSLSVSLSVCLCSVSPMTAAHLRVRGNCSLVIRLPRGTAY